MWNPLASRTGRLTTFFFLYLTEGIPLGFAVHDDRDVAPPAERRPGDDLDVIVGADLSSVVVQMGGIATDRGLCLDLPATSGAFDRGSSIAQILMVISLCERSGDRGDAQHGPPRTACSRWAYSWLDHHRGQRLRRDSGCRDRCAGVQCAARRMNAGPPMGIMFAGAYLGQIGRRFPDAGALLTWLPLERALPRGAGDLHRRGHGHVSPYHVARIDRAGPECGSTLPPNSNPRRGCRS